MSFLKRALDSVAKQKLLPDELIVVDDASTDGTHDYLLSWSKDHPFTFKIIRNQKNHGVSFSRNQGIVCAKGEWIAFLDSDDEWLAEKLSTQVLALSKNPNYLICHGEEIWIRQSKRVNPKKKHQKAGGDLFARSLGLCLISPSAVILHRSIFNRCGFFREDYPVCEDYDLWLKICAKYLILYCPEFLLKKYGGHDDQLSHKYVAMDYWRIDSMLNILQKGALSADQEVALRKELNIKAELLLKGYLKHKRTNEYTALKSKMKKLSI